MSIFDTLTSLFAPDCCLGCNREGHVLCTLCHQQLPLPPRTCFSCHARVEQHQAACNSCLAATPFSSLQTATSYQGLAKALVASLKFHANQRAAAAMAQASVARLNLPPTIIVAAPATTAHIRERGYDQAQLYARNLARQLQLPYAQVFRRHGHHHQLGADREQRRAQLQSSLRIRSIALPAEVILVDDVLTTGSTMIVLANLLQQAGVNKIHGVTFSQA